MVVNVWYAGALLLAFAVPSRDAEVYTDTNVDTYPSTETTFPISKQFVPSTTSVFGAVTDDQLAIDSSKPFISRPASLFKQQRLVTEVIERTRGAFFIPSSTDSRWKIPFQGDMNGDTIFAQFGLQLVPTPATGNCQYYAVAMSLLDMRFDSPQKVAALEQVTQYLKEGITEASLHGYDVEFPHDVRQTILVSTQLDVDVQEVTIPESEDESDLLFREYIRKIAQSPSSTTTYLPTELWGTEVTLRMMAKLLQQPIFLIIAPYGLQTTINYQVYMPERVNKDGYELDSVEEYYFAGSAPEKWFTLLQGVCDEVSSTTNPPIILLFQNFHYNRVKFVELKAGNDEL